jgi:BirA family transcriptional regulator, biotin operon repressor / biotin---[acetyl-CoA-carboxylase] ligase
MTNPYTDLDRPPLREAALRRALVVAGGLWTEVRVRPETASTNADVLGAARDGAPEGLVIVAESQVAGRGRLGRRWDLPPRAGLALSVLLRPVGVPTARLGWLPLLAGVALVETVRRIGAVDAVLKWPNDLLIDGAKCGGILAEAHDGAVAVGIGLNTTLRASELPVPTATSLALAGAACTDRDPLLRALLRGLADRYVEWREAAGDPDKAGLQASYLVHCATVGREVRIELPAGATVTGHAEGIDLDGRLLVTGRAYAAGDVVHLR